MSLASTHHKEVTKESSKEELLNAVQYYRQKFLDFYAKKIELETTHHAVCAQLEQDRRNLLAECEAMKSQSKPARAPPTAASCESQCPICLQEKTLDGMFVHGTESHAYCYECAQEWFTKSTSCPNCMQESTLVKCFNI